MTTKKLKPGEVFKDCNGTAIENGDNILHSSGVIFTVNIIDDEVHFVNTFTEEDNTIPANDFLGLSNVNIHLI